MDAVGNDMDTWVHLKPGSYVNGAGLPGIGNGLQINSRMQAAFAGPNQAQFPTGSDYGAILRIGAGSAVLPPFALTVGPLSTTPVGGALEYDSAGKYWLTKGTTSLSREIILTQKSITIASIQQPAGMTTTYRRGDDWIEFTIVVGAADITAPAGIAKANISLVAPGLPVIVGSFSSDDPLPGVPSLTYFSGSNKISVGLSAGTMRAGVTYVVSCLWRIP